MAFASEHYGRDVVLAELSLQHFKNSVSYRNRPIFTVGIHSRSLRLVAGEHLRVTCLGVGLVSYNVDIDQSALPYKRG